MAKQVIRITEGDLHRIITESVNRILNEGIEEGQGWDYYKSVRRNMKDNPDKNYDWNDFNRELKNMSRDRFRNFIQRGGEYQDKGEENKANYYDPEDPLMAHEDEFYDAKKPVNKSLGGKIGRAAGLGASIAHAGTKAAYNSMRNRFKGNK